MSKHLVQDVRNGRFSVVEIPVPVASRGNVLIANRASLISAGTERATMKLAQKSYWGKARERPDEVRKVLQKLRQQGVIETFRQVNEKLDEPLSMGYCSSGTVISAGEGVQEFKPGDRVASNGSHAEIVEVPRNLCARMGDSTSFESGAFGVLGAIALHGIRLSRIGIGETAFVIGLGLVGQLTVSILHAMGVRVIATDLDSARCQLALAMGADKASPRLSAQDVCAMTNGGADTVLITASTPSNEPISLSVASVRKKGRIVLVGVVGLELDRRPFYFKEAEFVVSCSYGPGRYDPFYEENGHDYPSAYVRWTEQRNIQAVLDLMDRGLIDVTPLISHRFDFQNALEAYERIDKPSSAAQLGVILTYPARETEGQVERLVPLESIASEEEPTPGKELELNVIGSGNYAKMTFLPALKKCDGVRLNTICSKGGISAVRVGGKHGFRSAATDATATIDDPTADAVCILTRHNKHASQVLQAIRAGKHVFVEKPLCLAIEELREIDAEVSTSAKVLMVGYNRRFAPATRLVNEFFADVQSPRSVSIRFNAGSLPPDHWVHNESVGGGRIIGEACHGIDLATAFCGSVPIRVFAESVRDSRPGAISDDQCHITMRHGNGSVSHVAYLSNGDQGMPKERIEVFGGGRVAVVEDFASVTLFKSGKSEHRKLRRQDKGHAQTIDHFIQSIRSCTAPQMTWSDIYTVSLASILAVQSLRDGLPCDLGSRD